MKRRSNGEVKRKDNRENNIAYLGKKGYRKENEAAFRYRSIGIQTRVVRLW